MIREFDERSGWNTGFRSCAHWLNWRTGLELGAAREKVRVAKALGELPRLSEAMRCGDLSYSKVRALTRVATADNEIELLEFARAGTAAHASIDSPLRTRGCPLKVTPNPGLSRVRSSPSLSVKPPFAGSLARSRLPSRSR